ncbi:MAG: hypothetical protein LLG97_14375 [Deltaproteobacteria bacterium]|nr:hypothetical protein [Deltaproteobacteria bacterium]
MKTMGMDRKFIFRMTVSLALLFTAGCADIRLNTLPNPSPTAKLRVFVLPVSGTLPRGNWLTPQAEFAQSSYRATARMLNEKGIYTVVPPAAVQRVTGGQEIPGWQWERNDWELARKAGRALHADYLFIPMRGHSGFLYVKLVMINLETGALFEKLDHSPNMRTPEEQSREQARIFRECYQEIFRRAKGDMLATAIRKGRMAPAASGQTGPEAVEKDSEPASTAAESEAPGGTRLAALEKPPMETPAAPTRAKPEPPEPPEPPKPAGADQPTFRPALPVGPGPGEPPPAPAGMKAEPPPKATDPPRIRAARPGESGEQRTVRSGNPEANLAVAAKAGGGLPAKERLIVYDLQTTAQLNVVALILSEALREELFALGGFELINREDMGQAIQEMKLQQSGLIDDSQALQIGKWLAANQTITGNLGILGDALILQTKRTDLQTMVILSRGSIRAGVGKEQELLDALNALARKLIAR